MSDDGGQSTGPDSVLRSPPLLAHQRLPLPTALRFPIGDTDAETDTREPSLYDGIGDGHGAGQSPSALPSHPGAGPAADVLATLLMDAKQDLDRVHWMLSLPASLFIGAVAAGVTTAVALWPGAGPACDLATASHRTYATQLGAYCAGFGAFCGLLLRVVYRVCRDLLSLEGVARNFRSQLAGFVVSGSALLEGHPYSRRDLHHLYSSHAKGVFLVIYIAMSAVGGVGTPFFASGAFCSNAPFVWPLRTLSLACGAAAYILPLFCFSSSGLGLGVGRGPAAAAAPSGREHPRGNAYSSRRGSASPDFGGRAAAAAAAAAAEHYTYAIRQQEETMSQGGLSARHTPRAGPQRV